LICPHCGIGIQYQQRFGFGFSYPQSQQDASNESEKFYMVSGSTCPECQNMIILLRHITKLKSPNGTYREDREIKQEFIFPVHSHKRVEPEVPEDYKKDFLEAYGVLSVSPKASAALSRRLLQQILREEFNILRRDLATEIDDFIKTQNPPTYLSDAIDAIRNIGNFAAHPLKSTSTGQIVDVEPNEAEWLIDVLEALFDFTFVQPKRLEEKRKKLDSKLSDLGKPHMK
jgi:hypothetical protein